MANLTPIMTSWRGWRTVKAVLWKCTLLVILAGFQMIEASATDEYASEQQVKAAYLYKFGSYVEWPERAFANAGSPFVIGIVGADSLADELMRLAAGRSVNGHPVVVRKLQRDDAVSGVNVLFIGRSSNVRLGEILASTKGSPILIVTESDEALSYGSMINFVIVDGRVRFEAAPKTASLGNLNISARLLAAAYKVAAGAS